jgi:hypothetical protein
MRFIEWLNETKTVPQLRAHIRQGFPDTKKRQHVTHDILRLTAESSTDNGNTHKQLIDISNVKFQSPTSDTNITITDELGRDHSITPVELNVHYVKVNCDCADYQYRFAHYNIQNKCHIGPPPAPYTKTTDRPPVNPMRVPGMCKHLLKIIENLQKEGILL